MSAVLLCMHGFPSVREDITLGNKHQHNSALLNSLKTCTKEKDLSEGHILHADILRSGLYENSVVVGTALVHMYATCGALAEAQEVFDELPARNVVSWSTLIRGYTEYGFGSLALDCFERMQQDGLSPDMVAYACILKACGSVGAVKKGAMIHAEIVGQGLLVKSMILGTALMDMYAKCNVLAKAQEVFEELPVRNVVSWSALIAAYVEHDNGDEALKCYDWMQLEGISPNRVTFACVLKACGSVGAVDRGKQIHTEVARRGLLQKNDMLGTALVDMYAKCGALTSAQNVFNDLSVKDIVAWSALIGGYAQHGHSDIALRCYERMREGGLCPNSVTFISILIACGNEGAFERGKEIHAELDRQGLWKDDDMLGTALMNMYAKCGILAEALEVFDQVGVRNMVTWNALILGYARVGDADAAMNSLRQMQLEGLCPDAVTFGHVLRACGCAGAAEKGEEIRAKIVRHGLLRNNTILGNALVDMHVSCGELDKAEDAFAEQLSHDAATWSALIAGYAQHGHAEKALDHFLHMQQEGFLPDALTLAVLLDACRHSGLLHDGIMCFISMSTAYDIVPNSQHFNCTIDLVARCGHLCYALEVIEKVPFSNCRWLWVVLLGACQKWDDVNLGMLAFARTVQLNEKVSAAYVYMSNIFASAGNRGKEAKLEDMREENEIWLIPEGFLWSHMV